MSMARCGFCVLPLLCFSFWSFSSHGISQLCFRRRSAKALQAQGGLWRTEERPSIQARRQGLRFVKPLKGYVAEVS